MKRKLLFLGTLLVLLAGIVSFGGAQRQSGSAFAAKAPPPPPPLFQDNFDSYTPGPLPTGTGPTQWTSVSATAPDFAVAVATTQFKSKPNSLQFTLGSTAKGVAFAMKRYATPTPTHAARFDLYLDASLKLGKQSIGLFDARGASKNGEMMVSLAPDYSLTVSWFDSLGAKHIFSTGPTTKLTTGQWYTVELDQTNNATTGSWSLSLNGTGIASQSNIDTGTSQINASRFGDMISSHIGLAGSFYEDNVVTATGTLPTSLFQDNFDSYTPGPLPTGTGPNQWTSVSATGTGFAVTVSTTQANSKPNSLQFTLGSTAKGVAFAMKSYATPTSTHAARFDLYLDASLKLGKQSIGLFDTPGASKNTGMMVSLAPDYSLTVLWFDSLGAKHIFSTGPTTKLTTGQWYTVELDQTNNATTGSWSLSLNGTGIASQSNIDTGTSQINASRFGDMISSHIGLAGSFYEDNVVVTATQHIP